MTLTREVRMLHPIAEKWYSSHMGADACPTVEQLRSEREIAATANVDDPWGTPYRIICDSPAGTTDDIECSR